MKKEKMKVRVKKSRALYNALNQIEIMDYFSFEMLKYKFTESGDMILTGRKDMIHALLNEFKLKAKVI